VADADRVAELEQALARALSDLKLATEERRKLRATSPGVLEAVRHEREVMERIQELVARIEEAHD
jgi:sugar-specific transcriptional regulator TrmB